MSKGRSGQTLLEKQQGIIDGFSREIRNERNRTQLNATEQAILQGERNKAYVANLKEEPRISHHNPDSPLRGSKYWTADQWADYRKWLKTQKTK